MEASTAIKGKGVVLGFAVAAILVLVAAAAVLPAEAAFPGRDGKIVFTSTRDGNPELYVMNADGSDQTRLTQNPAIDFDADWSPDGARIAFVREVQGDREVWVMNADGSDQTRLTNDPGSDDDPDFSPDGTQILFTSNRDGHFEIYRMNADGSDETRLTGPPEIDGEPVYSPDGQHIAFTSTRDGGDAQIHRMDADGSNQIQLTEAGGVDRWAAYSPDGTRIAFTSLRDGNNAVWVMNADGSAETPLTVLPETGTQPEFSPDGLHMIFTSRREGNDEVFLMNPDGSGQTNLTNHPGEDYEPDWQPLPAAPGAPTNFLFANLTGDREIPGPGDPDGSAAALINLRSAGNEVCIADFARGIAPPTAMHIHSGAHGVAGPIVVDLTAALNGVSCVPGDPAVIAAIRANPAGFYLNIHNADFTAGAVRGQLEPSLVPSALPIGTAPTRLFARMNGAREIPGPGDPNGRGVALVHVKRQTDQVCIDERYRKIETPNAMHIHRGPADVAGPVIVDLTPTLAEGTRCVDAPGVTVDEIAMDPANHYVNIHNASFINGAIRGQLE